MTRIHTSSHMPSSYGMECIPPCWRHPTQNMGSDVEKCTPPCWRHLTQDMSPDVEACTPPCWRHPTQDIAPDVEKCTPPGPCWRHPTFTWLPGALLCRPPGPSPHTSGPIFTSPCWPVPCWLLHLATCRSRPTFPALLHDGQVGGGSSRAIFTYHGFTAVHQHHHHTIFNPVLISQNDQHHYIRNQKKN